jgi:hypothetical protein
MQQARTHRVGISFDVQCLSAETLLNFVNITTIWRFSGSPQNYCTFLIVSYADALS